jgi:hypothetical protein
VHIQLTGGAALVPFIFLQNSQDKTLLELAHGLGIKDVALVHLHDECFELISHLVSLSRANILNQISSTKKSSVAANAIARCFEPLLSAPASLAALGLSLLMQ